APATTERLGKSGGQLQPPHASRDIPIITAPVTLNSRQQHVARVQCSGNGANLPAKSSSSSMTKNIRRAVACDECSGSGRYTIGRPNDPSAELFVCEQCDGEGTERCCECREPATVLHAVNCRPALSMPLCARCAAEYLADADA